MTAINDEHGYFVCDPGDDGLGFAVIARNTDKAKEAVHEAGWCEHLSKEDMVCSCIPEANIEGLPEGMVKDDRDALCRGLYDYLSDHECDECGAVDDLTCYEGRALCDDCVWDAVHEGDEE